jgi:hypothetical protein
VFFVGWKKRSVSTLLVDTRLRRFIHPTNTPPLAAGWFISLSALRDYPVAGIESSGRNVS